MRDRRVSVWRETDEQRSRQTSRGVRGGQTNRFVTGDTDRQDDVEGDTEKSRCGRGKGRTNRRVWRRGEMNSGNMEGRFVLGERSVWEKRRNRCVCVGGGGKLDEQVFCLWRTDEQMLLGSEALTC